MAVDVVKDANLTLFVYRGAAVGDQHKNRLGEVHADALSPLANSYQGVVHTFVQLLRSASSGFIALPGPYNGTLIKSGFSQDSPLPEVEMQAQLMSRSDPSADASFAVKAREDLAEREIIVGAMSGCTDAFEQLVKRYEARIFRLAHTMAHQHEDAEEIVQNAFVQVFKNISRFRGDSSFYTWLARITINEALMKIRQRRVSEISIDEPVETDDGFLPYEIEDWGPTPEQRYSQTELQRILARTIAKLAHGYRLIFLLRDVEGFSTEETAQMVGLTACAVKTRLRRARNQLRSLLNEYFKPSFQRGRGAGQFQIRAEALAAVGIGVGGSWDQQRQASGAASMY